MTAALLTTSIPDGELVSRGKVRDIYAHSDALVLVATDRISAFDCVLSPGIPGRGIILTRLSTVIDPETGVDVVRMRLIEALSVDGLGVTTIGGGTFPIRVVTCEVRLV